MSNLVFLEPNKLDAEPFTTSETVAEGTKSQHHTITRIIRRYEDDFKEFGRVDFKSIGTFGKADFKKIYHLNEQQATLLITYMQNTAIVRKFKKALTKQFYSMRDELMKRKITRMKAIEARNRLTDAVNLLPDSPHKHMKYKHYTDLVYKILFEKNTKQLKEQYGVGKKDSLRDYFTTEELKAIEDKELEISVLINLGYDYKSIKKVMEQKYLKAVG